MLCNWLEKVSRKFLNQSKQTQREHDLRDVFPRFSPADTGVCTLRAVIRPTKSWSHALSRAYTFALSLVHLIVPCRLQLVKKN